MRWIWNGFRQPDWLLRRKEEDQFYSRYGVGSGVCFDIGANIGEKTIVFARLGSKVIAVEPVPSAADALYNNTRCYDDVHLIRKAVGSEPGRLPLHVGDSTTISSFLSDWGTRNTRLHERKFVDTIEVDIVTLDQLIEQFGVPTFCKIDVEGYEAEVLRGLSTPIPFLTFEWIPDNLPAVSECCETLGALGDYEYNYTLSSPLKEVLGRYVSGQELMDDLTARSLNDAEKQWGDVIARIRRLS